MNIVWGEATKDGYPIYKKAGFVDKEHRYVEMRYKYEGISR